LIDENFSTNIDYKIIEDETGIAGSHTPYCDLCVLGQISGLTLAKAGTSQLGNLDLFFATRERVKQ